MELLGINRQRTVLETKERWEFKDSGLLKQVALSVGGTLLVSNNPVSKTRSAKGKHKLRFVYRGEKRCIELELAVGISGDWTKRESNFKCHFLNEDFVGGFSLAEVCFCFYSNECPYLQKSPWPSARHGALTSTKNASMAEAKDLGKTENGFEFTVVLP